MQRPISEKLTLKSAMLIKLERLIRPKVAVHIICCRITLSIDTLYFLEVGVLIIDILR